ncbi:hypothetical protein LTR66_017999, partial [Elasticomyces elasticus]
MQMSLEDGIGEHAQGLKATGTNTPIMIATLRSPGTAEVVNEPIVGYTSNDRRDMKRMGKKQELRRNFRIISTIGFTTCVMGTWEILLT